MRANEYTLCMYHSKWELEPGDVRRNSEIARKIMLAVSSLEPQGECQNTSEGMGL